MVCLEELGCTVERDSDGGLWMWISGARGRHCVRLTVEESRALAQALAPLRVDPARHNEVARLLAHLNTVERDCWFELATDGELRCCSLARPGLNGLSARRVRRALQAAVEGLDSHLCRIEAVSAGMAPEEFMRP